MEGGNRLAKPVMKELILQVEDRKYDLLLTFLKTLDYVQVEETQVLGDPPSTVALEEQPEYTLLDLSGKLAWKGDALAEQRRLRDEW